MLDRDTTKVDSLVGGPDGHLSPHGWQEVLLQLVAYLLQAVQVQASGLQYASTAADIVGASWRV